MTPRSRILTFCTAIALVFLVSRAALSQDKNSSKSDHKGDPYYLATCPLSNEKMPADPFIKVYDGREIRFCCGKCPAKFEKDLAGNLAKIDAQMIKDQLPLYPLKTSVVSGKNLSDKPLDFIWANRLIRVLDSPEKDSFLKDPERYTKELDKAVIAQQGKDYPANSCVVSNEKFGKEMGKPRDVVLAGRLIRLCCNNCKKELAKTPETFVAKVDAARESKK